MESKKKILLAFASFAIIIFGSLLFIIARQRAAQVARFTGEAWAVITNTDFNDYRTGRTTRERIDTVVDESQGKRRRTTNIKYRYAVGGREIESQIFERGDEREKYAVGAQRKVCYDPRYPEESMLVADDAVCGEP